MSAPAPNNFQAPPPEGQMPFLPIDIVGSNEFGRYGKINLSQTYNMIISDNALVPYAGYKNVLTLSALGTGRGIYASARGDISIQVIGGTVYRIFPDLSFNAVGTLATSSGTVFIAENNNDEIVISDGVNLYVYNYSGAGLFSISNITGGFSIDFHPGYLSFQNGRLMTAATNATTGATSWRLSDFNNALSWPDDAQHVGVLQSKPDSVQAAVPFPGRGNMLFLFGKTVVEQWIDVGNPLFPYIRSSNFNVDYGCLNPATIAGLENLVVWLGGNEQSGPIIMYSTGGSAQKLSNDGIDFKFSQLLNPENSFGFLFKQDGHLIYQITFFDDNLTYIYDFNTQKFFTATDENLNHHIARKVIFFNNKYYFVAFNDGNLYEFGSKYTSFIYSSTSTLEIPRIRICKPIRMVTQDNFIIKNLSFTVEQGQVNQIDSFTFTGVNANAITTENGYAITAEDEIIIVTEPKLPSTTITYLNPNMVVDLSISRNGGQSFGGSYRVGYNPTGDYRNKLDFWQLGLANDATLQLRFYGFSRFVCFNGIVEIGTQ